MPSSDRRADGVARGTRYPRPVVSLSTRLTGRGYVWWRPMAHRMAHGVCTNAPGRRAPIASERERQALETDFSSEGRVIEAVAKAVVEEQ